MELAEIFPVLLNHGIVEANKVSNKDKELKHFRQKYTARQKSWL